MGTSIPSTPLNDIANAGISQAAGFATGAGILGAIGSMGTSLIFQAGFSIVLGLASSLFQRKPRPRRGRDLQLGLADPTTFLPVIYGSHRVTGLRTFTWTTGNGTAGDARFLWVCAALGHGPIAGIDEIYLDGYLAVHAGGDAASHAAPRQDFSQYVTAWKSYGTEGQVMYHPRTNARTITANSYKDSNNRYVDFSAAHGYLVGDTIYISGTTGISDGAYFVTAVPSSTRVAIGYALGGGLTGYSSLSGACDYYNPDLPNTVGAWSSTMQGKGVAYVLLRLVYDETRFPNGVPEISANVRGLAVTDPRAPLTGAITTGGTTSLPRHASAALVTESAAHGLTAGDIVQISGHSDSSLNGTHRVFDVPSSTTYRLPVVYSGGGTGGTRVKRSMSTTPALCIRDFLTNPVYGAGAVASELDDTAWGVEATYHETVTDSALANGPAFTNLRGVQQIVVSGGVATATTTTTAPPLTVTPHGYTATQRVTIMRCGPFNNVTVTIASVPTASTFTFSTAVANGTYNGDLDTVTSTTQNGLVSTTQNVANVRAVTTGPLFTCNGLADPSQAVQRTIEELLSSCHGLLIYQSGLFRLVTPRATTPLGSFALTDDTIIGDVTLTLPGERDAANIVSATFPNAASANQQDTADFPPPFFANDLLVADNQRILRKEVDLPFTDSRAMAQQLCMVLRRESRARVIQCVASEKALLAQVGDVVNVTREVYGFVAKPFRILTMAAREDDLVELTLAEHDDAWYNLDPNDDVSYYDQTPPTVHFPPLQRISLQDFRNVGLSGIAGAWAADDGFSLSYTIFSSTSASISIPSHTLRIPISDGDYIDLTYNSGTVSVPSALNRDIPLYVYIDDPTMQGGTGGAGGYNFTTSTLVLAVSNVRRYVGRVTIPSGSSGSGVGLTRSLAAL